MTYSLILATDVPAQRIPELAKEVSMSIDGIKIGVAPLMEEGRTLLNKVQGILEEKPIFIDAKLADIGHYNKEKRRWEGTNAKILEAMTLPGIAPYVTVHAFPGPASLEEAITVAHDLNIKVLTLPFMTGKGAELFFEHPLDIVHAHKVLCKYFAVDFVGFEEFFGYSEYPLGELILWLADYFGTDGFICPANAPRLFQYYKPFLLGKEIWSPGFGRQDILGRSLQQQLHDWKEAFPSGYAVIGSTIYNAKDPALEAQRIRMLLDEVMP